jgi:hypothetical protein
MTPCELPPTQRHRYGDRAVRRTPSAEKLTALGATARWGSLRSGPRLTSRKTGLAPKYRDRWYRAGGRCPMDRAAAIRVGERPQQANTRPSAGLQNHFSSSGRESACKPGVFLGTADDPSAASPVSVRHDADALGDCPSEKDLQMQAFSRAADGIRTHDLLLASRRWGRAGATNCLQTRCVSLAYETPGVWDFTPIAGRLRTE